MTITNTNTRRGLAIILSSPSGAGKTTIEQALVKKYHNFVSSISITTRKKRTNEKNGVDYHFVTKKEFLDLKQNNQLLESEKVFDHYYGTSKKQTEEALNAGKNIIYVINWQGALNMIKHLQDDAISFFILPPSIEELERRLVTRGTDTLDEIEKRLAHAPFEISKRHLFHHRVVNDNLSKCISRIKELIDNKQKALI